MQHCQDNEVDELLSFWHLFSTLNMIHPGETTQDDNGKEVDHIFLAIYRCVKNLCVPANSDVKKGLT